MRISPKPTTAEATPMRKGDTAKAEEDFLPKPISSGTRRSEADRG